MCRHLGNDQGFEVGKSRKQTRMIAADRYGNQLMAVLKSTACNSADVFFGNKIF